jgi:hypothetical protein
MLNYFHIYSHLFLHQQTPCICPPNSKLYKYKTGVQI